MDAEKRAPLAEDLVRRLRALALHIDSVAVHITARHLPSYPDGPRPTSRVWLAGGGAVGEAEHVGWSHAAHESFRRRALSAALAGSSTLESFSRSLRERFADPYDRAALEAAAIDLALHQAESNVFALLGVVPRPVRYVVSLGRFADPRPAVARELACGAPGIKIDVDPLWRGEIYRHLAATGRVQVLDFKRSGSAADHEQAHELLPHALLEDPRPGASGWSEPCRQRISLDASILSLRALESLSNPLPAAVNIKAARMGGVLEAIDSVAWCRAHDIAVYVGGMFEIGVGRRQLLALAALLSPDAPNDIAPIPTDDRPAERPQRLAPSANLPGFG